MANTKLDREITLTERDNDYKLHGTITTNTEKKFHTLKLVISSVGTNWSSTYTARYTNIVSTYIATNPKDEHATVDVRMVLKSVLNRYVIHDLTPANAVKFLKFIDPSADHDLEK